MAGHHLIDAYLADLARTLPGDVVDELADGLTETWQRHRDTGLDPGAAAHAAIAEFGTAGEVSGTFVRQAPGRRLSRLLLTTGPVAGACWGLSLGASHAWRWPIGRPVAAGYLGVLLVVAAALVAAATARRSYRRTRWGIPGAVGLAVLDLCMIGAALGLATTLVWPMAIAIPASLTRVAVVVCRVPRAAFAG